MYYNATEELHQSLYGVLSGSKKNEKRHVGEMRGIMGII
jgi:hypothetical protein